MTRAQLEHIIRASAAITGRDQFVIFGFQAIVGQFANPPRELTLSMETDIYSPASDEDATLIEGTIGEGSPFHATFGYFAHGVGEETAVAPPGWKDRLVRFETPQMQGAAGLCVEVHDLAIAKLAAGRDKDVKYVRSLLRHQMLDLKTVRDRIGKLDEPNRGSCLRGLEQALRWAACNSRSGPVGKKPRQLKHAFHAACDA